MVLMRVGLTGATGMLGRHIYYELEHNKYEVVVVNRISNRRSKEWDLREWKSDQELDKLFDNVTCIVTCGALVDTGINDICEDMYNANVRSCINIGEWALRRKVHLIHISGAIVYKDPYVANIREDSQTGYSGVGKAYGLTKVLADHVFENLRLKGLSVSILRPSSIYGYGTSQGSIVGRFLKTSSEGSGIYLAHPVEDRFNLIHAADVASGVRICIQRMPNSTINIGSQENYSLLEIGKECNRVVGNGSVIVSKDISIRKSRSLYSIDSNLAKELIGWVPKIDLEEGLRLTFEGKLKS